MKRQFEGFNLPAKRLEHDPSKEYVDPKPVEAKVTSGFDEYDELFSAAEAATAASGLTDFSQWSEAELRTFLDQRGEDFDDCRDRDALMERARECEANTGPAVRPTLPGATAHDQTAAAGSAPTEEGEEVDPLDAFMAEMKAMEDEAKAEAGRPADGGSAPPEVHGRPSSKASQLGERMESDDHVADYVEALGRRKAGAAAPAAARGGGDSDEEVYAVAKAAEDASIATAGGWRGGPDAEDATVGLKRDIESLQPLAHDAVQYDEFNKEFYEPPPEMAALDPGAVTERRRALGIRVSGYDVPAPVETFAQCGFEKRVMMAIGKAGYEHPTPIQAQALPVALSGRDVLVSTGVKYST